MEEKNSIKEIRSIDKIMIILIILLFGIILMFRSHSTIIKIIGFILFLLGPLICWGDTIGKEEAKKKEIKSNRIKYIIDKMGGAENIDINLGEDSDKDQLIILKDKSILIGYNNYETEKIINFDFIINIDIRINNIKKESLAGYTHYHENIIESIIVYIHTNECTEELIFRYSSYEDNQEKYNGILKNLNRFKVLFEDTINRDDLDNKTNINYKEKSIPDQIKEYKELLDIGAITESEYENKKNELLSK